MNSVELNTCENPIPWDKKVTLTLPDKPEFISLARMSAAVLANLAGMDLDEVEDIKVALSEACTNALRYGCTNDDHYEVGMELTKDALVITVEDTGDGYDFESVKEPHIGGDQVGGFGIFIIRSLMDETEIKSEKGQGTVVKIQKKIKSRSNDGDEGQAVQG